MHDQTNLRDAASELDQIERTVLHLLLDRKAPGLLSEAEVAQGVGSDAKAAWALVSLHASGLIHRLEDFVFPTRPAVRFNELEESF